MSGILSPITDILAKLNSLQYPNNSGQTTGLYASIWNNQSRQLQTGENYAFPLPATFVEVITPDNYNQLSMGVTVSDVTFRIHLLTEELDSNDGTMDQNIAVFQLRDAIIRLLTYYQPTACSNLQMVSETMDNDHTNLYHFIIDFNCSFIDDRGDIRQGLTTTGPPTALDIISGLNPLEIFSITYTGSTLIIDYRLLYTQDVQFSITGGPVFDAGTLAYGNGQYVTPAISLAPGTYSATGKALANNYTTAAWSFQVT